MSACKERRNWFETRLKPAHQRKDRRSTEARESGGTSALPRCPAARMNCGYCAEWKQYWDATCTAGWGSKGTINFYLFAISGYFYFHPRYVSSAGGSMCAPVARTTHASNTPHHRVLYIGNGSWWKFPMIGKRPALSQQYARAWSSIPSTATYRDATGWANGLANGERRLYSLPGSPGFT